MVLDLAGHPRHASIPAPSRGWYVVPEVRWDSTLDGPAYEFVNAWSRVLYEWCEDNARPAMLVIDETNLCVRGSNVPPALLNVVMHGRKLGVSYAFATRRWVEIPARLRSQADDVFCFNQFDPTDLRAAEERGFDPLVVRRLRTGEFMHRARAVDAHLHTGVTTPCTTE